MLNLSKKKVIILMGVLAAALLAILIIMPAGTEAIEDSKGEIIEGSIAEMEEIKLGGADQWLVIRGEDRNKPVLLMLSGGPGSSEMGRFLKFNQELEKDFVVVIWEQRGSGKSFSASADKERLTLEQYVSDVNELSQYLKRRFNKEKIYLIEEYFEKLNAPKKKLIYFEQSHHGEIWSEADKFHEIMVNQVKKQH